MSAEYHPEKTPDRKLLRRRARRRTLLIAAAVFSVAAICYYGIYRICRLVNRHRWSQRISRALESKDIAQCRNLIGMCRIHSPELLETPQFINYQQQLLKLLKNAEKRRQIFHQKLSALQKMLADSKTPLYSWALLLADAAQYAADEDDLAELRNFEKHCRILEHRQKMLKSQDAVDKFNTLKRDLVRLKTLRKNAQWREFNTLLQKSYALAGDLQLNYPAIAMAAVQAGEIKKLLNEEAALAAARQQFAQQEKEDFRQIFYMPTPSEVSGFIARFIQKYPQSSYLADLKILSENLGFLQRNYIADIDLQLEKMLACDRKVFNAFRAAVTRIIAGAMRETRFELRLYIYQRDKRSKEQLWRLETWEKAAFSAPDSRKKRHITFTTVDGKKVSGTFNSNKHGTLTTPDGTFDCRIALQDAAGELPVARWQDFLHILNSTLQEPENKLFARTFMDIQTLFEQEKFLLPDDLQRSISALLTEVNKDFNCNPAEFIFQKNVLNQCRRYIPEFAGLLEKTPDGMSLHTVNTADNAILLTVNSADKKTPFAVCGKISAGKTVLSMNSPENNNLLPVVMLDKEAFAAREKWKKTAAKNKFSLPELPAYLK